MKARVEVRHYEYVHTAALHAMYDTVHRVLINRCTHTYVEYFRGTTRTTMRKVNNLEIEAAANSKIQYD
jgi:hypothetical protein